MTRLGKMLSVVALGAALTVPTFQAAQAQDLGNLRPELIAGATAAALALLVVVVLDESDATTITPGQTPR